MAKGLCKSCGCISKEMVYQQRNKINKYDLSGEYGIGYTSKNEIFYFDKDDYDKIKYFKLRLILRNPNSYKYIIPSKNCASELFKFAERVK